MSARRGMMALAFQESITAIVRLRGGRQTVADAEQFRQQMRDALRAAARQARDEGGYETADVRSATFAVVAFLDVIRDPILTGEPPSAAVFAKAAGLAVVAVAAAVAALARFERRLVFHL